VLVTGTVPQNLSVGGICRFIRDRDDRGGVPVVSRPMIFTSFSGRDLATDDIRVGHTPLSSTVMFHTRARGCASGTNIDLRVASARGRE